MSEDVDVMKIADNLTAKVKEFFPEGEIPTNVIKSLDSLKVALRLADIQLGVTMNLIINEIKKIDNLKD